MKYSLDRFLKIRFRSEKEIRDKLRTTKFDDSEIEREIKNLKKVDLVNDERFTKFWVEYRTDFNIRGRRFIEYELKRFGIEKEMYEKYFSKNNEYKNAKALVKDRYFRNKIEIDQKLKNKIMGFLSRKGFSMDVVIKVMGDIIKE
jgi:regulatory protein